MIHGRSDATPNRGGVRMGTAEFYRVVETVPGVADSLVIDTSGASDVGRLLLFVVLDGDVPLDEVTATLCTRIRAELSPRHAPDEVIAISEIPRTLNGKKCEVPVKRVLAGLPIDEAVSEGALRNPAAMTVFAELSARRATRSVAP